nr:hypothetical protein [Limosilactobacillus mucosae]
MATQNQSTTDFDKYSIKEQLLLLKFCKELTMAKTKRVATYSLKHWAEHYFEVFGGPSYVSTGAMNIALLKMGFKLDSEGIYAQANVAPKCEKILRQKCQQADFIARAKEQIEQGLAEQYGEKWQARLINCEQTSDELQAYFVVNYKTGRLYIAPFVYSAKCPIDRFPDWNCSGHIYLDQYYRYDVDSY